jgi:regulator of protease activity HflC (stomatin/prohibitin superfamily)
MRSRAIVGLCLFAIALVGLTIIFGSWYTIDQGERGVVLRNGAIIGSAEPGLHFKLPIIDSVQKISVQSRAQTYEKMLTYSRDQQTAELRLSVNYRIHPDQVSDVYSVYGGEEGLLSRLIDRRVYEQTKNVFGQFNAVTSIQDRSRLNSEIFAAIRDAIKGPVIIESVQMENIDFSEAYEHSIEQRMLAEVEVQKIRQNAEREKITAEITVIQAKAKADAVRAEAQANADAIRLKGDAEASAIRAKGEALRDNPNLVGLVQAERWNGILPTTMVPGSTVPFLNMTREVAR